MAVLNCNFRCGCTAAAVIASIIIGVVTAFLQVTAIITAAPVFLWAVFGIAVLYLGVLIVSAALKENTAEKDCLSSAVGTVLAGVLGTVLFSVILLAVGIIATSVFNAVLLGILLFFFSLMITGSACLVKCLFGCGD